MSEIHDSDLYSAATNALASDASQQNTFEKMVQASFVYIDPNDFKKAMYEVESTIRSEYALTKMPSPWRSAKSVVLGAIQLGISMLDENGVQKGKTALQNEIKAKKAPIEEKAPIDTANEGITKIVRVWGKLSLDEQNMVKTYFRDL